MTPREGHGTAAETLSDPSGATGRRRAYPHGTVLILSIALLVACAAPAVRGPGPRDGVLALADLTVVDVEGGRLLPHRTVLIAGGRIARVSSSDAFDAPPGTRVVPARGKYLIPGLWDMHVHLFNQISRRPPNLWYFPLFVANGVTGVREMWTKPADAATLADWRERIAGGALLGPRIAAAGALVDGPVSWWPTTDRVATPEEARRFVREAGGAGLDFVKVYSSLSREVYFAIADEARRTGIPVAGHIPLLVRTEEAAAAGQSSNEHLHQVREACSTRERQILDERERLYSRPFTSQEDDALWERHEGMRAEAYDAATCEAAARRLAAAPVWQVPTLVNERLHFLGPPEDSGGDPRLAHVPAEERRIWSEGLAQFGVTIATASEGGSDERRRRWAATLTVVGTLARAGVPFLAGTDLGGAFLFPGSSLHEELALLVEAGLTPPEALRAATVNPARYLEMAGSLGTVEAGKLADLVLLDADPLEDIRNTRRIGAVVLNGRYLDRGALDELRREAERSAGP